MEGKNGEPKNSPFLFLKLMLDTILCFGLLALMWVVVIGVELSERNWHCAFRWLVLPVLVVPAWFVYDLTGSFILTGIGWICVTVYIANTEKESDQKWLERLKSKYRP